MAGWDFQLGWNTSMLFCTKARVNTPAEWGGTPFDWFNKEASEVNVDDVLNAWQFGLGINNTEGTYNKCECFGPSIGNHRNPYNGSLAIVTLWFRALQTGTTTLEFSKLYQGWLPNVHLSDPYPHPIPKVEYDGLVEIREPINIPTQQAVWLKK